MILAGLFGAYLTLFCGGIGIALLLMRCSPRINVVECICLGWIFGIGNVSLLLWILGLFCSGTTLIFLVSAECLALAVAGAVVVSRSGSRFFMPWPRTIAEGILSILVAFQILIVFWISFHATLGWDGLLLWEAKARFAFLSHNVLPAHYYASGRSLTHPDYPLGIPLSELWFYAWMGEAHQFWIKPIFATFYAAGMGQLAILSARLTGRRWIGYVAAFLFFFVPREIFGNGSVTTGYADVPLSIVYLIAAGYLLLSLRKDEHRNFAIYAAALALLPWLKREGIILWLILAIAGVAIIFVRKMRLFWLTTLLPGALVIFGWALFLHFVHTDAPRDFAPFNGTALAQNAGRLISSWQLLFQEIGNVEPWGIFWFLAAAAIISLLWRIRDLQSATLLGVAIIPVAVYSSIYIFSTVPDYAAHIKLSISRLLMHVVPVLWLAIASAVAAPLSVRTFSTTKLRRSPDTDTP
jgi:hypothetical protein